MTFGKQTDGLDIRYVPLWAMFPDPYSEDFYESRYVIEEMALDEEEIISGMATGQFYELNELGSPVKWEYELDLRGQTADKWAVTREGRKRHSSRIQHGNWYDDEGLPRAQKTGGVSRSTKARCSPSARTPCTPESCRISGAGPEGAR